MDRFAGIVVENAESMTELERLEAAFTYITNISIGHIENDLAAA